MPPNNSDPTTPGATPSPDQAPAAAPAEPAAPVVPETPVPAAPAPEAAAEAAPVVEQPAAPSEPAAPVVEAPAAPAVPAGPESTPPADPAAVAPVVGAVVAGGTVEGGQPAIATAGGPKKSKKGLLLIVLIAVVVLVAAAAAYFLLFKKATPTSVFNDMLANNLSTKSVEKTYTASQDQGNIVLDYSVSDVKNPVLATQTTVNSSADNGGVTATFNTWADNSDTYINYQKLSIPTIPSRYMSSITGKWIHSSNSQSSNSSDPFTQLSGAFGPQFLMLDGGTVFGNFSSADRKSLLDYIAKNNVYKYDPKQVTKQTLDGKSVYVYKITESADSMKGYLKKVAGILGYSDSDVQTVLDNASIGTATVYVDIGSKHVVKSNSSASGDNVDATYTKYNAVPAPQKPKADLESAQVLQTLVQSAANGGTSGI